MKMKSMRYGLLVIIFMSAIALLVSCGPSGGGDDSESTATTAAVEEAAEESAAAFISLATSQTTVQSDNSDSATITATVLDAGRAVLPGATVSFSADGGQISASSVDTNGDGEAQISFSAGSASGGVSQVVTITAVVAGLNPATIPIQVVGTSVVLTTDNSNITVDDTVDLTVHVEDFSSGGIQDVLVELSVSSGAISLSTTAGYTNVNGELVVQVTGEAAGSGTVTAVAMGITATLTFTVGTTGTVFGIIDPITDPCTLDTDDDLPVIVNAPGVLTVTFATTLGTFTDGVVTGQVIEVAVVGDIATADLSSLLAGVANIQVYDKDNPSTKDSLTVAITAPPEDAFQISLQPSESSVAPSFGDVSNSITLEATVKNDDDQVVGNAAVAFSILNPTGGGESISPVVVFTGTDGIATSTFTSGTLTSGAGGVTIKAVVVDAVPPIEDTVSIVIGGTPGSVIIGRSTKVSSIAGDTAYSLPMSVLVADPGGNPVSGAIVSLNVWPANYYTGFNPDEGEPVVTGGYPNEDVNRNLILDAGEDTNVDGSLTPPNAAAGSLPASVETDESGVASFNLVYLKSSAVWIDDEITATTVVSGTETSSTLVFSLPYAVSDEQYLPHSPYGYGELTIDASAGAGGTINPSGAVPVPYGANQTFTITGPVADVLVDGDSVGVLLSYTFINVTENHTISVIY